MNKQTISSDLDTVVNRLSENGINAHKKVVRQGTIGEYEHVIFEPAEISQLGVAWDAAKGLSLVVKVVKIKKAGGVESVGIEILSPISLLPESKRAALLED